MTKKEYILDFLKEINYAYNHPAMYDDLKRLLDEMEEEILESANEALKKQPCEDAISRESAIKAAIEGADIWDGRCNFERDRCITKEINKLSPVSQMPSEDCIRRSDIGLTNFEIVMCNGDYKEGLKMLLDKIEKAPSVTPMQKWIPVSERLPRASEIVLLSLPEHTMVDGEECSPCVICGHYIGGKSEEWGISDGTTVGYGLVAYKHCKPIAWMPLPKPYNESGE